eukprot:gene10090-12376_t
MTKKHQANSFTNRVSKANHQNNPDRIVPKGKTNLRTRSTIRRLQIANAKPIYDRNGKFVGGAYMSKDTSHDTRIAPSRDYFGNIRVIGQEQLTQFREELQNAVDNPFRVLLRASKLPLGLLKDSTKKTQMNLLTTESFEHTFGPKQQRKRPNLQSVIDYENLLNKAHETTEKYDEAKDSNIEIELDMKDTRRHDIFDKGTSKRIWGELYKVIDSSDVLIQVLDARDPMGTRSKHLESQLKKNARHKHLVFILNKCDLVPTWSTARWVKLLSKEYPTLAFHASITNPFGKGSLIQLLRQFSKLHSDKKQISVGFIGYPNVGKSSIINTLKSKVVCKAAPIPGETKVWQYITLMKRIYLIDCPGVVPATGDSEADLVLKGVVRVENLEDATEYIPEVLKRIKKEYIVKTYGIADWVDHEDFLTKMAEKTGKLLKKNQPNMKAVAKLVLYDYQRGKIPFFVAPPEITKEEEEEDKRIAEELKIKKEQEEEELRVKEEAQDDQEDDVSSDDEEEEEKVPVKKEKATNGKVSTPQKNNKRKIVEEDEDDSDSEDEKPNKKKSKSPKSKSSPAVKKSKLIEQSKLFEKPKSVFEKVQETEQVKEDEVPEVSLGLPSLQVVKSLQTKSKIQELKNVSRSNFKDTFPEVESDEEEGPSKKDKRKTTNKQKVGVHFYETHNVKNRNRDRKDIHSLRDLKIGIKSLEFKIPKGSLPDSVHMLSLMVVVENHKRKEFNFKETLEKGSLPQSVTLLTIDHLFFKHDIQLIPESVCNLVIINFNFVSGDTNLVPSSVRTLFLEGNQDIPLEPGCLPSTITELHLGDSMPPFTPLVPGVIPSSVRSINLGSYDYPLSPGLFPESLEELHMGHRFNQVIKPGTLPNVRSLSTSFYFLENFENGSIPSTVTLFHSLSTIPLLRSALLPSTLTHLIIRELEFPDTKLPDSLVYLECSFSNITKELFSNCKFLQTIKFQGQKLQIENGAIPDSVIRLEFSNKIEILITREILPPNLRELIFYKDFSSKINEVDTNNQQPPVFIPDSVRILQFQKINFQMKKGFLPEGLLGLHVMGAVPLEDIHIPESIQELIFSHQVEPIAISRVDGFLNYNVELIIDPLLQAINNIETTNKYPTREFAIHTGFRIYLHYLHLEGVISLMVEACHHIGAILNLGHLSRFSIISIASLSKLYKFLCEIKSITIVLYNWFLKNVNKFQSNSDSNNNHDLDEFLSHFSNIFGSKQLPKNIGKD